MSSIREKPVRRKVVKSERATHTRIPGWILDLECGHTAEVNGWGDGSGIGAPNTTICRQCTAAAKKVKP